MKRLPLILLCGLMAACMKKTPLFQRLPSETTGINFTNTIFETDSFNILKNEYMYNGGGVGIGDLNNDGLQDIVFAGNHVLSKIYLNKGELSFLDITEKFEGLTNDQWYSGVAMADINGDGLLDIYLTATTSKDPQKRRNKLWVNQGLDAGGIPTFTEQAENYGIADEGYSVHAGFLDYDLDGDLDLYVLNNIVNQDIPTNYRPKIQDGSAINNDKLYQNQGDNTFKDVTVEAGILYEGFGLGLAIADVNKDGYPDIFVSNDYISNDLLYINQQDGSFRNESENFLSYHSKFSMGNDISDINNDGNPDIMTLDMMPESYSRKKQTINGNSYFFYVNDDKYGYEHQYVRNMVHLHNGFQNEEMLPFSEVGQMLGIFQTEWSWSPLFADYDNDGDRDLLITNGFPKDLTDKDFTNYKAQVHGFVASDQHVISRIPIVKVPNYAYENLGDLKFANKTEAWGMNFPSFSNGAAFGDLDNDGDLDYIVSNLDDEIFFFQNNTINQGDPQHNYIRIKLVGEGKNTMALGSKVELWSQDTYQFQEHYLSRGYISSIDPVIHFGLGKSQKIDSIKISWPRGTHQTILKNVDVNQYLTISEHDATELNHSGANLKNPHPLFKRKSDLIDFTHQQEDYIDFFESQRIIQHKFSQIGPCLAKGDIDNDGQDDLIIGASDNQPTTVFLHHGNQFVKAEIAGLTDNKICTESDLVLVDVDGDGDQDLIALAGGYANKNPGDYKHYLYLNQGGTFEKTQLPLPAFPASTISPFDFDHDGDTDFFVGARVEKGKFPYAPQSFLVINQEGSFSTHEGLNFELGMVTDAIWSDYDRDGWEDLIVAREWAPLTILKNESGKSLTEQHIPSLEKNHGLWLSLAAVDMDNDGDEDFIAGNLGKNNRFQINDQYPMRLYAVDLDRNGVIDPITTAFWKDDQSVMQEYPINYFDELVAQSPYFRKLFTSYTSFSHATIREIVNIDSIPANEKYYVNTTSSYILWNENGAFRWEALPASCQLAPIREMLVRDFNGDQYPDVLIAGNDHTHDVSTGYYDANKGLILINKGDGSLDIMTPAESGLILDKQVESLIYFEGDTSYVVVGINRNKIVAFQHLATKNE